MQKSFMPTVVPPGSKFRLLRADHATPGWEKNVGRIFRIGYYSKQDGLDCIWLVDEKGNYEQTVDRDFLVKNFEPLEISHETDFYGVGKLPFGPLT